MSKVCFFSFQEPDRDFVALVKGRAVNPRYTNLNFRVQDLLKRWDTESDSVIRQAISKSINGTSRTIVFVGDTTHNSYWVGQEVEMTLAQGKPVYAIALPTRGLLSSPPAFLVNRGIRIYPWSEETLQLLATHEAHRNLGIPSRSPWGRL